LNLGKWKDNTNEGLSYLTNLINLTSLSLHGWKNITSLEPIKYFPNLTDLDLSGCLENKGYDEKQKLSGELNTLKAELPNLKVKDFYS
jgi:hypothetical protein